MKEEDTCVRPTAVEEEEEMGRRKAGGEEEREKIDEEAETESLSLHTGAPASCDTCCEKTGELINGAVWSVGEEKNARDCKMSRTLVFFLSFKINCIKTLVRNSHHVRHQSCSYLS